MLNLTQMPVGDVLDDDTYVSNALADAKLLMGVSSLVTLDAAAATVVDVFGVTFDVVPFDIVLFTVVLFGVLMAILFCLVDVVDVVDLADGEAGTWVIAVEAIRVDRRILFNQVVYQLLVDRILCWSKIVWSHGFHSGAISVSVSVSVKGP